MNWFRSKATVKIRALSSDAAYAYAERAQLSSKLLSANPPVSLSEFSVFWSLAAGVMNDAAEKGTSSRDERVSLFHENTRDFFLSFGQSFVSDVLHSTLNLVSDCENVQKIANSVLETTAPERAREIVTLMGDLAANAARLSGATLTILYSGLNEHDAKEVMKYASAVVRERADLSHFEKTLAIDWINSGKPSKWSTAL